MNLSWLNVYLLNPTLKKWLPEALANLLANCQTKNLGTS